MIYDGVFVAVLLAFAVKLIQIQRRTRKISLATRDAQQESILLRTPVQVKHRTSSGRWPTKTMGLMELVIRANWIEVKSRPAWVGAVLGNAWYMPSKQCRMRYGNIRGDPLRREWITISGRDAIAREVGLALRSLSDPQEAMRVLVDAGVGISDDLEPPA